MLIGLLSDTHGYLDPRIFEYFKNCDEIWHAGDIGESEVADALAGFKPLKAVFGNVDGKDLQLRFPEDLWMTIHGVSFLLTHIAGTPPGYNPRVRKLFLERTPDVLICGHSHILKVGKDPRRNNMLFVNPGAAGNHGFHIMKTVLRFEVTKQGLANLEVIELGKRGQLKSNPI
jgi:uncharacterized protein